MLEDVLMLWQTQRKQHDQDADQTYEDFADAIYDDQLNDAWSDEDADLYEDDFNQSWEEDAPDDAFQEDDAPRPSDRFDA